MDEFHQLLLEFSSVSHEPLCRIDDCVIPGEDIVEEELDDDMIGAAGGVEEADQDIQDNIEMVEEPPRVLTLLNSKVATQDVLDFLMDNQD